MTYDAHVMLMGLEMMHDVLIWRRKLETLPETRGARAGPGPFFPRHAAAAYTCLLLPLSVPRRRRELRGMSCSLLLEDTP